VNILKYLKFWNFLKFLKNFRVFVNRRWSLSFPNKYKTCIQSGHGIKIPRNSDVTGKKLLTDDRRCYILIFPPTHSSPRKNEYILVFPPERSVYTHLSPLIFRGEIWVYTEVSPSYSILPLCTADRLYIQIQKTFDFEGGLGRFLK
jgi:hypothetical protein